MAGDVYRAWLKRFPPDHVFAQQNAALMLGTLQQIDGEAPWPDRRTTTLLGLHELWAKWCRPNDETKRALLSSIEKLIGFVGHGDVTRLTTEDIRQWCSSLKQRTGEDEIGGIRIRDGYLAAVKAVLNSAVTQGYLKSNPAAGGEG